ncbi:MAG: enolase C-terminal domain-like protein [Candidatus Latescibacterota bacterium]|nr:enolase C-terminal domain-like protein [Candidatus Latescibacterota bacterium]
MSKIKSIALIEFQFHLDDIGIEQAAAGVGNMAFVKGAQFPAKRFAVRIDTDDGCSGEYVTHWVGTPASFAQAQMLAPVLIGKDPEHREQIYDDLKRELRAYDHMGHGALDIAIWDLCGKMKSTSVKSMLGGYRETLPTYASTYHGQETRGGLCSPEAFADFAEECKANGFHGFKIHGWNDGNVEREVANLLGVRKRVGDNWRLMIDPACQLRTWMDALTVGHACDEACYFWYEDPYRDAAVSAYGHNRLREQIKTPLLISEHVRGLEQKASFMINGGCDMIHVDPEYDMGITGVMKTAHFCEALGLDLQLHACGPAHRLCISAIRNTHMYEMALMGPGMPNTVPPVYTCGYSDQPSDLPPDGRVPVPDGPGLGVSYDWDYIKANQTQHFDFA